MRKINDKSRKDTWRNNGWQVLKFNKRGKQQIQKSERILNTKSKKCTLK